MPDGFEMMIAPNPEGILLIDKPSGMTSHDVVDRVRRKFRIKRVGHAGTLDPLATGLLILLIGKATKASQYLISLDKEYVGTLRLGQTTDSHDADGKIVEEQTVPTLNTEQVQAAMNTFLGDQYQIPPIFSAKKVNGVPLYKLARKGKVAEREPRLIRVAAFDLRRLELPEVDFHIACTKGTYVRTLGHDLGQKLGCGAHLAALRRTVIDHFSIENALSLECFETLAPLEIVRKLIPVYQILPSQLL